MCFVFVCMIVCERVPACSIGEKFVYLVWNLKSDGWDGMRLCMVTHILDSIVQNISTLVQFGNATDYYTPVVRAR